jgi:hypothetical protein
VARRDDSRAIYILNKTQTPKEQLVQNGAVMDSKEVTLVAEPQRRKPPAAGRGRQKGELNKLTRTLKEAILAAFDEVGGRDYLVAVAKDDPKTFCGLLARVLPMQVQAEVSPVQYRVAREPMTPEEWADKFGAERRDLSNH